MQTTRGRIGVARCGVLGLSLLAACAGGKPATAGQIELEARRLLQPFVAGGEVGCQELLVEVSPNLVVSVSQPTIDVNLHSAAKQQLDGCLETVWTNKVGDLAGVFVVVVGEQDQFTDKGFVQGRGLKFTVTNQVRMRVHESGPMRLDVSAKGDVLVFKDAGGEVDLHEFRIQDGVLHRR